jgi:hypothetical protein
VVGGADQDADEEAVGYALVDGLHSLRQVNTPPALKTAAKSTKSAGH